MSSIDMPEVFSAGTDLTANGRCIKPKGGGQAIYYRLFTLFDWKAPHYLVFRSVLLVGTTLWHALMFPAESRVSIAAVAALVFMVSPYGILCLLARWINRPVLLVGSTLAMLVLDACNAIAVMRSTSSTAGVALLFFPLFLLLVAVPAVVIIAVILRRALDSDG